MYKIFIRSLFVLCIKQNEYILCLAICIKRDMTLYKIDLYKQFQIVYHLTNDLRHNKGS